MNIFKEKQEEALNYADSVVNQIVVKGNAVIVTGETYDQSDLKLKFSDAELVHSSGDWPEIVSEGQILKLKNGLKRLILFSDANEIFLEIEYGACKKIL